jgi:hypothetical protein
VRGCFVLNTGAIQIRPVRVNRLVVHAVWAATSLEARLLTSLKHNGVMKATETWFCFPSPPVLNMRGSCGISGLVGI